MAWKINRGQRYYYRNQRIGKRVLTQYIGTGIYAEFAAEQDAEQRQAAKEQREAWRRELAEHAAIDRQLDELGRHARQAMATVLRACGFRQHKREWRRKRMNELEAQASQVHALFQRTRSKKATPAELAEFRQWLQVPELAAIYGDLAGLALKHLLIVFNENQVFKESATAHIEHLKTQMGYEAATGLERMLIDQICLTWVRLAKLEMTYSQECEGPLPPERLEFFERLLTSAQFRHLRATESLARVRRLLYHNSVQVNIADQQIIAR